MGRILSKHWPIICVLVLYWGSVLVLLSDSLYRNHGHLVYALDDPYIQMSMAKNVVQHGVWGITRYEFSNSTSSPLWTGLLTLSYLVFGVNEWSPLALNIAFGSLALITTYIYIMRSITNPLVRSIILAVSWLVTPLPALTFSGMEHVFHALLSLAFLYFFLNVLASSRNTRHDAILLVLSASLPMTRYEGLFLILVVCIALWIKKRARLAGVLGLAALMPISLYGLWSISQGWYFFPNSVLLKGNLPETNFTGIANFFFGFDLLSAIQENLALFILLLLALAAFLWHHHKKIHTERTLLALAVWIAATLIHIQLAALGWFYRYEGYLIFTGIAVLSVALFDLAPKPCKVQFDRVHLPVTIMGFVLLVLIASPLGFRAYDSFHDTPQATNNIYEQQYQMGLFVRDHYQGAIVALNDVGAVNFLADIKLLDLWGLGSRQVASLRLQKHYRTMDIAQLASNANVSIAIVYDGWYTGFGGLPLQWNDVGKWRVTDNVVLGGDTVTFYAVKTSETDALINNLRAFQHSLPRDVKQSGRYLQ